MFIYERAQGVKIEMKLLFFSCNTIREKLFLEKPMISEDAK